jgi:RluA family pseudouridine synthase
MKEFQIRDNEAGQRFDKYLSKLLRNAPKSFFYKMLRKKNITLNGKKATGNEKLEAGDQVKLFLSDETFDKFSQQDKAARAVTTLDVLYEDADVLLINKPAGMLSQPDDTKEPSMVEYVIGYLLEKGELTEEDLRTFRPSVCNRLDKNTSGIIAAGKSLAGLQELSELFHDRTVHKEYLCIVKGVLREKKHIKGYLYKDAKQNKVAIYKQKQKEAQPIETVYEPLEDNGEVTLLKVGLITGRTHQIRAHLASEGHPLAGDTKYGQDAFNRRYREKYQLKHQLLHAFRLSFPDGMEGRLSDLSGKCFRAPLPAQFERIIKEEKLGEKLL